VLLMLLLAPDDLFRIPGSHGSHGCAQAIRSVHSARSACGAVHQVKLVEGVEGKIVYAQLAITRTFLVERPDWRTRIHRHTHTHTLKCTLTHTTESPSQNSARGCAIQSDRLSPGLWARRLLSSARQAVRVGGVGGALPYTEDIPPHASAGTVVPSGTVAVEGAGGVRRAW